MRDEVELDKAIAETRAERYAETSAIPSGKVDKDEKWIIFQVGHDQKPGYRFILVPEGQEVRLRENEWIDTTTDAEGMFGGSVEAQDSSREALYAALQRIALHYNQPQKVKTIVAEALLLVEDQKPN